MKNISAILVLIFVVSNAFCQNFETGVLDLKTFHHVIMDKKVRILVLFKIKKG